MNWGRAKTILIILFLAIDILLLCLLAFVKNDVDYIKDRTITETVSVLNNHGINVEKELIPRKRTDLEILNCKNLVYSPEEAAQLFLGEGYKEEQGSDGQIIFKKDSKTLCFAENKIYYEHNREISECIDKEAEKAVVASLREFGYKRSDFFIENAYVDNGIYHAELTLSYNGRKIIGTEAVIEADNTGILKMCGVCFSVKETEKTDKKLTDVTSVLTGMIYEPAYFGKTISKIEVMYYIDSEYIDGAEVTAYPVYAVTDSENQRYILK